MIISRRSLFQILTIISVYGTMCSSMSVSPKRSVRKYTTSAQREAFKRDGFLVVSDLLSDAEKEKLVAAGNNVLDNDQRKSTLYFQIAEKGVMICGPSNPALSDKNRTQITTSFRDIALRSKIPHVAAELMGLDSSEENVRVLRDLFLGKSIHETKTCGWHVDDPSFWPEAYKSSPSADGINAWIAMQDMPAKYGGSLGLAPGSHVADWRHSAYRSLGIDTSIETLTKEQIFNSIKDNGFLGCVLHQTSPEFHEKMEEVGRVPDLKCGDVIFHTRWLFHKTVGLNEEGKKHFDDQGISCLNRYSVRYVPGTARLPLSFVNELSILSDPTNAGRRLNEVDDAWYPTVWPFLEDDIDTKLWKLATGRVPAATKIMKSNLNELLELLNQPPKI